MENVEGRSITGIFTRLQVDKLLLVVAVTIAIPFIVHNIPTVSTVPLGAIWLPIFYAPFVAVIFYKFHIALITALLAPLVNMAITGRPFLAVTGVLIPELLFFVIISKIIFMRFNRFWGISLFAYVGSKFLSSILLSRFHFFLDSLNTAIPGLLLLFLLNLFILRHKEIMHDHCDI